MSPSESKPVSVPKQADGPTPSPSTTSSTPQGSGASLPTHPAAMKGSAAAPAAPPAHPASFARHPGALSQAPAPEAALAASFSKPHPAAFGRSAPAPAAAAAAHPASFSKPHPAALGKPAHPAAFGKKPDGEEEQDLTGKEQEVSASPGTPLDSAQPPLASPHLSPRVATRSPLGGHVQLPRARRNARTRPRRTCRRWRGVTRHERV